MPRYVGQRIPQIQMGGELADDVLVDVRDPGEFAAGHAPDASVDPDGPARIATVHLAHEPEPRRDLAHRRTQRRRHHRAARDGIPGRELRGRARSVGGCGRSRSSPTTAGPDAWPDPCGEPRSCSQSSSRSRLRRGWRGQGQGGRRARRRRGSEQPGADGSFAGAASSAPSARRRPRPAAVHRLGWEQQNAYRALDRASPLACARVAAQLPADVQPIVIANERAGSDLRALGGEGPRPRHLPDWHIVSPPPVEVLRSYYDEAEAASGIPWAYFASIHLVETRLGRIRGTSSAGAQGPMQFIPETWARYGQGDINDNHDAILAAARLLQANGGPERHEPGVVPLQQQPSLRRRRASRTRSSCCRTSARSSAITQWQVYSATTERHVRASRGLSGHARPQGQPLGLTGFQTVSPRSSTWGWPRGRGEGPAAAAGRWGVLRRGLRPPEPPRTGSVIRRASSEDRRTAPSAVVAHERDIVGRRGSGVAILIRRRPMFPPLEPRPPKVLHVRDGRVLVEWAVRRGHRRRGGPDSWHAGGGDPRPVLRGRRHPLLVRRGPAGTRGRPPRASARAPSRAPPCTGSPGSGRWRRRASSTSPRARPGRRSPWRRVTRRWPRSPAVPPWSATTGRRSCGAPAGAASPPRSAHSSSSRGRAP